jgi:RNA polymerase sigma factor (sigma-70 family)
MEQREFHLFASNTFSDLQGLRKDRDIDAFNNILMKTIPDVRRYIQKRLNDALRRNQIDKGRYKADDFVDQLFIEVYENFEEVVDKNDLYPWLFKKADELMEEALVEEEFDTFFFENIDNYSKLEWDAMEEKFSTDGDGDLVMIEELDDSSYRKNDYILNHVFIEDGNKELIEGLDTKLDSERVRKHTEMVLSHLPTPKRKVFELFTEHQIDVTEIAKIRSRTVEEVETLLKEARKSLQTSLLGRYAN